MVPAIIRGSATGLGFYDHVAAVQTCDDASQTYFAMWVDSISRFMYGSTNHDYLEGIWHFTDSMG